MAIPFRVDGRRQRGEVSRQAIVAAMLALVRAGNVAPGAEQVAARAGVGLRTVFRHFENMESLYREMNALMVAEILPLAEKPFAAKSWRDNLDEMLERRADIFERILPVKIAADINRHKSQFLARETARINAAQRSTLEALLPKSIREDGIRLEALDLVLSFDTWRRLRKDQNLTPKHARTIVADLVARLVD
jgi:AcrR family transcriptional regulator